MMSKTIELGFGAAGAVGIFLVGEATIPGSDFISTLITSLGPVGFIVWFAWYTLTKRDPEKEAHYEKIIADIETKHAKTNEESTIRMTASLDKMSSVMDRMVTHCEGKQVVNP